jgi:hypothetical protein
MGPAKLGNARAFGCSLTESLRAPNGYGTVSRQDTYQLIEFLDPGAEALGDGVIPELRTGHRGLVS